RCLPHLLPPRRPPPRLVRVSSCAAVRRLSIGRRSPLRPRRALPPRARCPRRRGRRRRGVAGAGPASDWRTGRRSGFGQLVPRRVRMIAVARLSKLYGQVTAVEGLSFTVPDGSITGVLGPNGAGKSTTMRCLLGLHKPTTGTALIDGLPLTAQTTPAEVVGAVLDASSFHPGRTGLAHPTTIAASAGLPDRRAWEVLEAVALTQAAHRRIGGYSLGMKQRLGLAAALLGRPRNIVLDEPMNGLDPQGMEWMRAFLRDAAASGHAV